MMYNKSAKVGNTLKLYMGLFFLRCFFRRADNGPG